MVRVQLLKNNAVNVNLSPETITMDILADKVKVPADETTYWCHVHKLPDEYSSKHHVVQVKQQNINKY